MRAIRHVVRKEFLQLRRDRRMLWIVFVAPVIQLMLLGYAANLDIKNIPTVVCDMDNSRQSREMISSFEGSEYFRVVQRLETPEDINWWIDRQKASIAIMIPRGFGERLLSQRPAQIQVIADGADANSAMVGLSFTSVVVNKVSASVGAEVLQRARSRGVKIGSVDPAVRVWFNPELKSRNFMIPGVLGLLLMVMTMILTSLAVVKEKEIGTLEQLVVTPIKPFQLIIGKLTPFTIIGMIDVALVLCVATFWFKVPVKGSVPLLVGLCAVFLMTTLGLGLFVSTVSRTQQQAMLTAVFFVIMPMMFLSGFVFPIENMPKTIQFFTYLIPLRYFFVIVRGLFLRGVGMEALWDEALVLFLIGVAILGMSVLRTKKRLA